MNFKMNERRPLKVVQVKGEGALILEIDGFSPSPLQWSEKVGAGQKMVESVTFKKKKVPGWLLSTDILPTSWWLLVCNFMGFQRIKHCIIMFGY